MIKKWILGNFKSVASVAELPMAPVTVFAGANSSGKSTILQSILMIAQTFQGVATEAYPVVFNGNFTRLGSVRDVLNASSSSDEMEVGFELAPTSSVPTTGNQSGISLRFSLFAEQNPSFEHSYGVLKSLSLRNGKDYLELRLVKEGDQDVARHRKELFIPPELEEQLNRYAFLVTDSSFRFRSISPFQPQFRLTGFLPAQYLETYDYASFFTKKTLLALANSMSEDVDSVDEDLLDKLLAEVARHIVLGEAIKKAIWRISKMQSLQGQTGNRELKNMANDPNVSVNTLLDLIRKEMPGSSLPQEIKNYARARGLRTKNVPIREIGVRLGSVPELESTILDITNFFRKSIYYIGPLREPPQYIYLLPPSPGYQYVGSKGEFAPTILERFKGEKVDFPLPPGKNAKAKQERGTLIYALGIWLEHMGLLSSVKTEDLGKAGTKLSVQMAGVDTELDLTSVGVGISQVLPLLVGCLLAPRGTTFLLEQPELHLHPKVQSILADFFLGLTKVGKQVIVETHSEYLINRLRRRVAEDESDTLADDIQIYFVEREGGESIFRSVDLNAYGAVVEWPKGFFDEGPNEAQMIMTAAIRKRRKAREKQRNQGGK